MRLGHVGLAVQDPDTLANFYAGLLGLRRVGAVVTEQTGRMVLMSSGPERVPDFQLMSNPQGRHVAFRVDTLAELRELYAVAPERQARVLFSFDHGSTLSFYFLDPEGNACEVYWDTGRRPTGGSRPVDLGKSEEELLDFIST